MDWILLCGLIVFVGAALGCMELYLRLSSWVKSHGNKVKSQQ